MQPFNAPLDDIFFSLTEVCDVAELDTWDEELTQQVSSAYAKFVEGEIAPLNEVGDREGCTLVHGRVLCLVGLGGLSTLCGGRMAGSEYT